MEDVVGGLVVEVDEGGFEVEVGGVVDGRVDDGLEEDDEDDEDDEVDNEEDDEVDNEEDDEDEDVLDNEEVEVDEVVDGG